MSYRELELEDFALALKLLHSPAINAKEEILKLVEKYSTKVPQAAPSTATIVNPPSLPTPLPLIPSSPVRKPSSKSKIANISDDSETDVEDDDNDAIKVVDSASQCYMCKSGENSAHNSDPLMKCMECSTYCHRECHKPPITKAEYDPRFIWYCQKCTKGSKKSGIGGGSVSATTKPIAKSTVGMSKPSSAPGSLTSAPKRKLESSSQNSRKPTSSSNFGSSGAAKIVPPSLAMTSAQQRIASRKIKK